MDKPQFYRIIFDNYPSQLVEREYDKMKPPLFPAEAFNSILLEFSF